MEWLLMRSIWACITSHIIGYWPVTDICDVAGCHRALNVGGRAPPRVTLAWETHTCHSFMNAWRRQSILSERVQRNTAVCLGKFYLGYYVLRCRCVYDILFVDAMPRQTCMKLSDEALLPGQAIVPKTPLPFRYSLRVLHCLFLIWLLLVSHPRH